MSNLDQIKTDLKTLSAKEFYTQHIIRTDNWYFSEYMHKSSDEVIRISDDYRLIVSECFNISFNSVLMVGSGKLGFSLSPPRKNNANSKFLKPFNDDEKVRNISDIDIAIISADIFQDFWKLFRVSYKMSYENTYQHLYRELYRGYINEKNITNVEKCRKEWNKMALEARRRLSSELYFKQDVSFRIYRSWEDFEDYNIQNINNIKKEGLL